MWLVGLLCARADALEVGDATDAWYASETDRGEEAAAWYLAHRDDDPASARNLYLWLDELGWLADQRLPSLLAQVRAWGEAHPAAQDHPTALAMAHALAALGPGEYTTRLPGKGPWCAPALEALAVRPEAPEADFRVLNAAVRIASACDEDTAPLEAERDALAMTGEAGPWPRAWIGAMDGIDEADVEAIRAALDSPADERLGFLARYARDPKEGEDPGPGREAVKALLVERARALAGDDRPSRLWAAVQVLRAAGLEEEETAARQRLRELDPGNLRNVSASGGGHAAGEDEVEASTVLDPAQRLAALVAEGPPRGAPDWDLTTYWLARADAAALLGDPAEELASLRKVPGGAGRYRARAIAAALATGHARSALKLAERGVELSTDVPVVFPSRAPEDHWRTSRAEALDLRAWVLEEMGRRDRAIDDLEEALALAPPTSDRLRRLGRLYADQAWWRAAAEALGRGLVGAPEEQAADDLALLDRCLAELPGWAPDRASWLAGMATPEPEAPAEEGTDEARFADLTFRLDGQEQRLFDLQGPIVLDVWATWCGPCMASLPHLEALARTYEGRVTFVAVSVDEELATAERYLERRGGASFRQAWLGGDGMKRLGVDGIPAMFVFDAEHRLVAELSGYGPGNTALDEAIASMLAGRP